MKWKYKIKLTIDIMSLHGKQLIGSIALGVFVFLLIAVLILMNEMNGNLRRDLNNALGGNGKNIGYIVRNDSGLESVSEELLKIDKIESFGEYQLSSNEVDGLAPLKKIQQNNVQEETNGEDKYLEITYMDMTAWKLFDVSISKGEEPEKIKNLNQYTLLYLGYKYEKYFNVGDVLVDSRNDMSKQYMVAGFIDKGDTFVVEDMNWLDKFSVSASVPLDYAVVAVLPGCGFSDIGSFFLVKDGYTYEETVAYIQQIAQEKNMSVTIKNMDAVVSAAETSLKPVNKYMVQIIIVVGFTLCIVFACSQTISIIIRKSEYGIFYANGLTTRDLIEMIILENVLKMGVSIIIMVPLFLFLSDKFFLANYVDRYVIHSIMLNSISYKIFFISFIMVLISSVIPIITIKKYTPIELIGGNIT